MSGSKSVSVSTRTQNTEETCSNEKIITRTRRIQFEDKGIQTDEISDEIFLSNALKR